MVEGLHNREKLPKGKLLVAPGFGESPKRAFKYFLNSLTGLGYDTVPHEHPRGGNKAALQAELNEIKSQFPILKDVSVTVYREAKAFLELAEANPDAVNAVGHSHGGLYLVVAAIIKPDLFQNLVLMNSAGFTGKVESGESKSIEASENVSEDRFQKLQSSLGDKWRAGALMARYARGLISFFDQSERPIRMLKALGDAFSYISRRLLSLQVFAEASGMANIDIVPLIEELQRTGISVSIIYDESDVVFPAKRLEGRIPSGVDSHKTKGKGHFGPVEEPDEMAALVDSMLTKEKVQEAA